MNTQHTFSATNLSVARGDKVIFEGLNYEINSGQLLKVVGPNGSGKSTLLKTIAGLIHSIEGSISSDDHVITKDRDWISQNLCYLGHKNALKKEFTVFENIEFWASIWGNIDKIVLSMKQMGITYLKDTPVRYLSSGQARRAALARSLCHTAGIWLFDEPTVGLDDQGLSLLSDAMKGHMAEGGMIICATHVDLKIDESMTKTLNLADFSSSNALKTDDW